MTTEEHNLFEEWSEMNGVIADWRSRFDTLREGFPKVKTREEAEKLLIQEEYNLRYPLLPDWLP